MCCFLPACHGTGTRSNTWRSTNLAQPPALSRRSALTQGRRKCRRPCPRPVARAVWLDRRPELLIWGPAPGDCLCTSSLDIVIAALKRRAEYLAACKMTYENFQSLQVATILLREPRLKEVKLASTSYPVVQWMPCSQLSPAKTSLHVDICRNVSCLSNPLDYQVSRMCGLVVAANEVWKY